MVNGTRGKIVTAIGSLAVASLVLAVVVQGVDAYQHYKPPVDQQPRAPEARVSNTARIAGALEAIRDDERSADQAERDRRSLDAQEAASRWARWSAWAAFVQILVGGIGIYALIFTLRQTQHSLNQTRAANRTAASVLALEREKAGIEFRPWLALDAQPSAHILFVKGEFDCGVDIGITNIGKSVAREVFATCEVLIESSTAARDDAIVRMKRKIAGQRTMKEYHRRVVLPNQRVPTFLGAKCKASSEEQIYRLIACVEYEFENSNGIHQTWSMFDIFRINPATKRDEMISGKKPIPPEEIRIHPSGIGDAT